MLLDVRNSYLKDEVKLSNILVKIPGVLINADGAVSMFGKNGIAIYIDGKEIVSEEMLKLLQPSDIDKIEVINQPGADHSLCANDIFHTYRDRVTAYNPNVCIIKNDNPNSRTFSLTVRYQLESGAFCGSFRYHNKAKRQTIVLYS